MKKNIKMMAVLSAAALMTVAAPQMGLGGAGSTAYAKTLGWVEDNGTWRYYEEDDYYLTDEWKKQDGQWYYLDENGEVAVNMQVDEYFVGQDGTRVASQWVSIANEEDWSSDESPEFFWYYYGKNGKAVTSKWQEIDGNKYYFDSDSRMVTGLAEIDGFTYYLGEEGDGVMRTGWISLEDESDDPDETHSWHYFDKNGKMVVNQVDRKIDNDYYTFENGRMQTGWYQIPVTETATPAEAESDQAEKTLDGYQYYDKETGKRASGWREMEGVDGIHEEGEVFKFYFKNGQPYFAKKGIELFTIDSKKYAFNTKGEMQTGLQVVNLEDGGIANFYFDESGVMQTGRQVIFNEEDGEDQNWFFHTEGLKKGQGLHGIRDNTLYSYGLRQEADKELRYSPILHEGNQYLVNANGAIQKASASSKSSSKPELGSGYKDVKDANDVVWTVDVKGIIQ